MEQNRDQSGFFLLLCRCLLYFMLVGESPFERVLGEAGGSLMLAVVK